MSRWEYKFVEVNPPSNMIKTEKDFRELGQDGWELVTIYPIPEKEKTWTHAIFKKQINF